MFYNINMSKEKVLEILEKNRGKVVSGEEIARALGVTRASVCKDIAKLRREGNEIFSKSNSGYILSRSSPALSAVGITCRMKTVRPVVYFSSVDSTNKRAKIMAAEGASDGTVIVADSQTEGHGRRGRSFYSPAGSGLYFSIILRPEFSYVLCQRIVPLAAVAVRRAIKSVCGINTRIKWVNDIYFSDKKIAGICTESIGQFGADRPDAVVLGIGINVSTQNFPAEIAETAGSLGVFVDRNALAAACVDNVFDMLSGIADATFMDEYRAECMTIGKQVDVFSGDKYLYSAKALEIDDDGLLIVQKESGETVSLITQEVSIKNRK